MIEILPSCDLWRLEESEAAGTFGVLLICQQVFCCTLEPADQLNIIRNSSIPDQQYICKRYDSPRFGETFKVMDVPGRTQILFHAGNTLANTAGCILLGQSFGRLGHKRAILNSGKTFKNFMEVMKQIEKFRLTIHEIW